MAMETPVCYMFKVTTAQGTPGDDRWSTIPVPLSQKDVVIASCSKNEAHERVLNGPHKWKKSMHSTELSAMSFESLRVMFAVVLMKLPKTTQRKKEHGPMIAD